MEDTFKYLLTGFSLLALFMFLILTFVVQISYDNNVSTQELQEGAFSLSPYESYLDDIDSQAENFRERFEKGNIFSVIAGVIVDGIFGVAKDMIIIIMTPFTLLVQVFNNVLGIPVIVNSVLLGILIFTIIFGIWRLVRIGD